ncbi:MAG: carbon starvation protein A, partial [Myxococcaceae bacterium]
YVWVPGIPAAWLVLCTLTAGFQKVFGGDVRVSFVAHARAFSRAVDEGRVIAPAKSLEEMEQIIRNDYLDAGLTVFFMAVVVATLLFGVRAVLAARRSPEATAQETPYVAAATGER